MHGQEEKPVWLTCYFYGTWMYILVHIYVPTKLALNISNNVNTKFKKGKS